MPSLRWGAGLALAVAFATSFAQDKDQRQAPAATALSSINPSAHACEGATPNPWPTTATQRQAQLQRLELLRPGCMESPGFLAVLGGLLLEDGDPEQALIWLERSLLLDPGNLGALADHALALASLGERRALEQLTSAWAGRTDVPSALRSRLFPKATPPTAVIKLGRSGLPVWGLQREISLLAGFETNLDQSPRLNELTLTAPDGNVNLTVNSQPRRAGALTASGSVQAAYSPDPGSIWRTGLTASARSAPAERHTDWTYVQWTASGVQRWSWWRTFLDLGASWVGGPLNEPYHLFRAGLAADVGAKSCRLRLGLDAEQRRQSRTTTFNAVSAGVQLGAECPTASNSLGTWSVFVRAAEDHPDEDGRPGGIQRHATAGARWSLPLASQWQSDISLRASEVRDAKGYSVLLENDARRWLRQYQLSAELTYRPIEPALAGAQLILQLHLVRQASNLKLFSYGAASIYTGLRWGW